MKKLLKDLKAEFQTFEEAQLLVAVSGGMDSMLMAELLLRAKIPFAVAHVNYQLRAKDSEKDEQFVKAYCKKINSFFTVRKRVICGRNRKTIYKSALEIFVTRTFSSCKMNSGIPQWFLHTMPMINWKPFFNILFVEAD
jgi:tRNA(Ile)-lysidine synthase TilS/MesJ